MKGIFNKRLYPSDGLKYVFFAVLLYCLIHSLFFQNITDIWEYGYELGFSFIVAYIFYFVTFRIDRKNKKTHCRYVLSRVKTIIHTKKEIINAMEKTTNLSYEKDGLKNILSSIQPNHNAPMTTDGHNLVKWNEYICIKMEHTKTKYRDMLPFLSVIDIDLMEAITRLMDTFLLNEQVLTVAFKNPIANKNYSEFIIFFQNYIELIDNLEVVSEEVKRRYSIK